MDRTGRERGYACAGAGSGSVQGVDSASSRHYGASVATADDAP